MEIISHGGVCWQCTIFTICLKLIKMPFACMYLKNNSWTRNCKTVHLILPCAIVNWAWPFLVRLGFQRVTITYLQCMLGLQLYSTDQRKPNRECLTEHVLLLFHTHSVSVRYPFSIRSVLFCSRSDSVPLESVLGTHSEERGFRELVYKNASNELAILGWNIRVCMHEYKQ